MYDVIIIGRGPAGISAALYTIRANLKTLIIGSGKSNLVKADKIENYFGFENPVSGRYLLDQGVKQVLRLNWEIVDKDEIDIQKYESFKIITPNETFESKAVLIATGQPVTKLKINNLNKFEGLGVSYCTTCDGFFYRNKKVGILGYKDFAVHEAIEMNPFTKDITIFTNGNDLDISDSAAIKDYNIVSKKIVELQGAEFLEEIVFEDGSKEKVDGLFIAYDSASSISFARKMGVETDENSIIVDSNQKTNVDGLYAAGDCTGAFKQISVAVGQGAMAGRQIIEYLRSKKLKNLI